jgi:hypothetical protein
MQCFIVVEADGILSWVVIPLWLMWDSYGHIAGSLRGAQAAKKVKKN